MDASMLKPIILIFFLFSFSLPFSFAQTCKTYAFSNDKRYGSCQDLPALSSYIHWTYDQATGTVDLAFRHANVKPTSWIAWAINPKGKGMVGSEALVAYQDSTTGAMKAYTSPVDSYKSSLEEGALSFNVPEISAGYDGGSNEMVIFAKVNLPKGVTVVNQVWQDGPMGSDGRAGVHAMTGDNVRSMGTLNLLTGQAAATKGGNANLLNKKKVHGIFNMVGFGFITPIGVMIMRYGKPYATEEHQNLMLVHLGFVVLGALVGPLAGGSITAYFFKAHGWIGNPHAVIGVLLWSLFPFQLLLGLLRPKPGNSFRWIWNIFHHCFGYSVLVLGGVNVLIGIDMLQPGKVWKLSYVIFLACLVGVVLFLEFVTLKKRRETTGVCLGLCREEDP